MDKEDNELLLSNLSKKIKKKNSIMTPTSPIITPNTFGEAQTFPLNLTFLNIPQEKSGKILFFDSLLKMYIFTIINN